MKRICMAKWQKLIKKTGINKFIGIGNALVRNRELFEDEARFFYTTDEFVNSFNSSISAMK